MNGVDSVEAKNLVLRSFVHLNIAVRQNGNFQNADRHIVDIPD
jgi:hypothetical protein